MDPLLTLVRSELKSGLLELEARTSLDRSDTFLLRALGNAARVLGHESIAHRVTRRLQAADDKLPCRDVLTNVDLPDDVSDWTRSLDPPEVLEARYPRIGMDQLVERIRSYAATEKHFALCLQGQFGDARALAGSGVRLEEVGQALAVLGEFDLALEIARDPILESSRQRGVRFIALIELIRWGLNGEADVLLADFQRDGLRIREQIHLALGVGGRDPWNCYPFPDW